MISSIPGVLDVHLVRGAASPAGQAPDLVIEIPHGATRRAHFDALRAQLVGSFPPDLVDFFFVNTDVGAPELAMALAAELTARAPARSVLVLVCQVPRTFIDCNRVIDESSVPTASTATGMTPGVVRYVTEAADFSRLLGLYQSYRSAVTRAMEETCGAGGQALMLHTYAPRSVDVAVDEKIVERLRAAYAPGVETTWPLRASIDLIVRTPSGEMLADEQGVRRLRASLEAGGLDVTECGTYPLHPQSLAWVFASRWPGRTLCMEVRRDLLVERFTPFAEMRGDEAKCARIARLMADAL